LAAQREASALNTSPSVVVTTTSAANDYALHAMPVRLAASPDMVAGLVRIDLGRKGLTERTPACVRVQSPPKCGLRIVRLGIQSRPGGMPQSIDSLGRHPGMCSEQVHVVPGTRGTPVDQYRLGP